jgi:hypothetical protein
MVIGMDFRGLKKDEWRKVFNLSTVILIILIGAFLFNTYIHPIAPTVLSDIPAVQTTSLPFTQIAVGLMFALIVIISISNFVVR